MNLILTKEHTPKLQKNANCNLYRLTGNMVFFCIFFFMSHSKERLLCWNCLHFVSIFDELDLSLSIFRNWILSKCGYFIKSIP